MAVYRTPAVLPAPPKKSLRCRLGFHAPLVTYQDYDEGYEGRQNTETLACAHCTYEVMRNVAGPGERPGLAERESLLMLHKKRARERVAQLVGMGFFGYAALCAVVWVIRNW
jgi:hypothetical protein